MIFFFTVLFYYTSFNPNEQKRKIDQIANRIDPDEVAHYEPPHLSLYYFTL